MKSRKSIAKGVAARSAGIAGNSNISSLRTLSDAEIWQVAGGKGLHGDEDVGRISGDEDLAPITRG